MRRLISTSEAERLVKAQLLLQEIEKRCEQTVYDEDMSENPSLELYRASCLGRAAEAAQVASDAVFSVLNCMVSQCEQEHIESFVGGSVHGDAV